MACNGRKIQKARGLKAEGTGDSWCLFVQSVQTAWIHGVIPCQLLWSIVVLAPNGGGDYRGIVLLEPIWKSTERVIDHWLDAIELHDSHHGCRNNHGTGTAIIEAKLAQQLLYLELKPFYSVFLDLWKAFDAMDWERCILLLEGYGAGPQMILVCGYWRNPIMVCRAAGYYGQALRPPVHQKYCGGRSGSGVDDAVVAGWRL